jgi:Tfp pilus assembly protein PilO
MLRNPNTGNSTKHLVQALIITAVAILLVGGALIALLNTNVAKLQSVADNKQAQVGSSEQVARRYDLTLSSYKDTIDHLKYLETSVTTTSYVPTMLEQIQALAQTTHLKVLSIRPSAIVSAAPKKAAAAADSSSSSSSGSSSSSTGATASASKKAPPYDTVNITLDISGTFSETAAFLYDLTRFPKIVAVTSATLHPDSNGGDATPNPLGSPAIHSTLQVVAYLFHDDTTPASLPTPPSVGNPAAISTATSTATTRLTAATATAAPVVGAAHPSIVPAPTNAATLSGAAQRAITGATGASNAARERTEVGVGTL